MRHFCRKKRIKRRKMNVEFNRSTALIFYFRIARRVLRIQDVNELSFGIYIWTWKNKKTTQLKIKLDFFGLKCYFNMCYRIRDAKSWRLTWRRKPQSYCRRRKSFCVPGFMFGFKLPYPVLNRPFWLPDQFTVLRNGEAAIPVFP